MLNAGAFRWLATDDTANTLAFLRSGGEARAVVVFNRSEGPQTIRFAAPEGWPEADVSAGFVSDGGSAVLRRAEGEVITDLTPLTAAVFVP
ncbi:MAG: alpha-glucosidase C-terminal domain-containing protein [Chthoniobacterales bacterium]